MDDLALAIERGDVVKLQVIELAELVERNDVGDSVASGSTHLLRAFVGSPLGVSNERCPANLKYPSSRDQNVI